jgi:hypothetical protein
MITNDARHICEINIHNFHSQSSIQKEEDSFHQQTGLKFKEETTELLHLELIIVWC